MRSNKTRMTAAIAAAIIGIAVLAGCSSNPDTSAKEDEVDKIACSQVTETAIASAKEDVGTTKTALSDAAPFEKKEMETAFHAAESKVETLTTRATECEAEAKEKEEDKKEAEAAAVIADKLAQCRTTAIVTYMTEQGFVDGEYVIGTNNVDKTKAAFTQQGSAGFRGSSAIPTTHEQYQAYLKSDKDNDVASVAPQVHKLELEGYKKSVILDADHWELVQSNVASLTLGNTGLNGDSVVAVGNTESEAGDAAWIFVDPDTCVVPRASVDAAGNPIPESTPVQDRPVAAVRPGCKNPTDGLRPKNPYVPPVAPPLDEKIPSQSSAWNGNNPGNLVRDNGEHQVNWNNGNTDAQGYQPSAADVAAAQAAAAKAAADAEAQRQREAEAARQAAEQDGAGTVDPVQTHTPVPTPGPDW